MIARLWTQEVVLEFHERRRKRRHKGMIPVEIEGGTGMTRDFSSSGVFFETDQWLEAGMSVEFALMLEHSYPNEPGRFLCQGKVVRVEPGGEKVGVAVTIDSYSFADVRSARDA